MKCSHHPEQDLVGYCIVCGNLGCNECFTAVESDLYCRKDFKSAPKRGAEEFKSIAETIAEQKRKEKALQRPDRQRLVVQRKDGQTSYGVCLSMNLGGTGFYIDVCDFTGQLLEKREFIAFADMKAVFYVKSFHGRFDRRQQYEEWQPEGDKLIVLFKDGEIMKGYSYAPYRADAPRFYLIPKDPESNNISVLIESSAVERVYTPAEYEQKLADELQAYVEEHAVEGVSRIEAEGDFYFHHHSYNRALRAYEKALEQRPDAPDLLKRCAVTYYNLGAAHIHSHEYPQALEYIKRAHELDPKNTHIHVKLRELERAVNKLREKHEKRKSAGA